MLSPVTPVTGCPAIRNCEWCFLWSHVDMTSPFLLALQSLQITESPVLRSFSCWSASIYIVGMETELPARSSSIDEISLQHSVVDDESLEAMVRSSRALQSLTHSFGSEDGTHIMFSPPSLGRVLLECTKDRLVHLHLDFPENLDSEPIGSLGSLREFSPLAHVSLPLSMLIPRPMMSISPTFPLRTLLPKSLVSLEVWIDKCWEKTLETGVRMFVELFVSKRDKLEILNELRVGGCIATSDLESIQSTCVSEK
jgi:hypothetical protein